MKISMVTSLLSEMMNPLENVTNFVDNLTWKIKLMMFWKALSPVHKIIVVGIVLTIAFLIISKLFKCNKKCS